MTYIKYLPILSLCFFISNSFASPTSNSMTSSVSLQPTCSIRADSFTFGVINQLNTTYIPNNIYVKCNNKVSYTINGDNRVPNGVFLTSQDGSKLQYAVLTAPNNAYSTLFTTPYVYGGSSITGIGNGTEKTHNIYLRVYGKDFGNIPLSKAGTYSDTFNISIKY